jgi:putative membrane protein
MKPAKIIQPQILMIALALGALCSADPALAQWRDYQGWHMGPGMMGGWGMGWFGGIFMIIFWILILVALAFFVKWLIQSTSGRRSDYPESSRALEILKERYARGEIDRAEFEEKKKVLT